MPLHSLLLLLLFIWFGLNISIYSREYMLNISIYFREYMFIISIYFSDIYSIYLPFPVMYFHYIYLFQWYMFIISIYSRGNIYSIYLSIPGNICSIYLSILGNVQCPVNCMLHNTASIWASFGGFSENFSSDIVTLLSVHFKTFINNRYKLYKLCNLLKARDFFSGEGGGNTFV